MRLFASEGFHAVRGCSVLPLLPPPDCAQTKCGHRICSCILSSCGVLSTPALLWALQWPIGLAPICRHASAWAVDTCLSCVRAAFAADSQLSSMHPAAAWQLVWQPDRRSSSRAWVSMTPAGALRTRPWGRETPAEKLNRCFARVPRNARRRLEQLLDDIHSTHVSPAARGSGAHRVDPQQASGHNSLLAAS